MVAAAKSELNPAACASSVSMHVVRVMVDMVGRAGVPRARMLHAIGLTEAQLTDGTSISFEAAVHSAETLLELSGDPAFGLRWAEQLVS